MDGSDESNPGNGNQSLPEQLVCIQCAGVVLSAGFVCRESRMGLTSECLQDVMGAKGACNNCVSYYFNLSWTAKHDKINYYLGSSIKCYFFLKLCKGWRFSEKDWYYL